MPIRPDPKDWTWVLQRPCLECGFDARIVTLAGIPELTRRATAAWAPVLQRADVAVRPDGSTWSALEYAAHVRDVYDLFRTRLSLMLAEDDPLFANWDQDAVAEERRYHDQDPAIVATELARAGEATARAFADVSAQAHERTGSRSDGARFTVVTLGQYFVHEPFHHLHDVDAAISLAT